MTSPQSSRPVVVVTGASAGIGKATAMHFIQMGWHVIGTGRDATRCAEAEQEIRSAASSDGRFDMVRGDFTRMADVVRVADAIAKRTPRLDILINNAGGVRDRRIVTEEGTEATFAANHLAPFLLTRSLLSLLKQTAQHAPAGSVRILGVTSSGHRMSQGMDWDDLQSLEKFEPAPAYMQAKLANILFTRELARRVAADGIIAHVMHPGIVDSNFASHGDAILQARMADSQKSSPDVPADALVWLATSAEAARESGRHFFNKEEEVPSPAAQDDGAAALLWTQTEALLSKLGFPA